MLYDKVNGKCRAYPFDSSISKNAKENSQIRKELTLWKKKEGFISNKAFQEKIDDHITYSEIVGN